MFLWVSKEAQTAHGKAPISAELAKMGPWGPVAAFGGARAPGNDGPLSKKNEYFVWRRSTARFVPFPKFVPSKRAYTYGLRQSARIVFKFP